MNDPTDLERLVRQMQDAGQAWVQAKLKADQLEEDTRPFLASLINELAGKFLETPETKLDRMARGSTAYRDYIRDMCIARAQALQAKVKYEGYQALFEARRSEFALERVKVEKGIYHQGG